MSDDEKFTPWSGPWKGIDFSTVKEKISRNDYDFRRYAFNIISFQNQVFEKPLDFSDSFFDGTAEFNMVTFNEVNFRRLRIDGPFILANIKSFLSTGWIGDFRDILFRKPYLLSFRNVSLSGVQFSGTDLRQVQFDNVTWASWWWRAAVYDEIFLHQLRWANIAYLLNYGWLWGKRIPGEEDRPRKPSYADFAPVERLYRQLKTNYKNQEDFKRVGDFHYGEMEMYRRASPWRRWVSLYSAYWALSGYGERPLRAFFWLLLLIPAWAGLVWGLGINQAASPTPVNYWDTLLFIFERATLQRPQLPEGITWLGKLLGSLSVLLLPGQAALFILALRNRLGRRR